jgi:hypothetical protein
MKNLAILCTLLSLSAWGSSTTTKQIDSIQNSTGGSTISVPSTGSNFASDTNTLTLQNKTISGSNNTFNQLPVATQTIQSKVTPYPNGSLTTFTLATSPGAGVGVACYLDGKLLKQGAGLDYTISSSTLTFSTAPATGQDLYCVYSQY